MERFKDAFDEIPLTLIKLLKLYDGGIYFDESKMLSAKEMVSTSERSSKMSEEWGKDWIPFAEDVDENLLLIDSKGKVRIWDPESEELEGADFFLLEWCRLKALLLFRCARNASVAASSPSVSPPELEPSAP